MECAGIAEAGGVKNVTQSLCKNLKDQGHNTTLFIPWYKCTSTKYIKMISQEPQVASVTICGGETCFNYKKAVSTDGDYNIIFIEHNCFSEKEGVYTYTLHEEQLNPEHQKGTGHKDTLFKNTLFAMGVAKYIQFEAEKTKPDIIHCQDASTALVPLFLKMNHQNDVKTVVTIHNAGPAYHHYFSNPDEAAWFTGDKSENFFDVLNNGKPEPFLIASKYGATLTTVSEIYAQELCDPKNDFITENLSSIFTQKNIFIKGITNGIDFDRYDPLTTTVSCLPYSFDPEKGDLEGKYACRDRLLELVKQPLNTEEEINVHGYIEEKISEDAVFIGYHGRVASQKGIEVLISSITPLLQSFQNIYFIIMGQGERLLEEKIKNKAIQYPGKILFLNGYDKSLARLTTASCDFMAFPSFFEPCGLEDYIANIYGSIPVAHKTGGLNKIKDMETGFLYYPNLFENLSVKLATAITIKRENPQKILSIIKEGYVNVRDNCTWETVIKDHYVPLYKSLVQS